jgi:hypothetical protein
MKRISKLLYGVAIMMICGAAAPYAYAQSATGLALFAYPMEEKTPEQVSEDRAACNEWAIAQTGFDPSAIANLERAGISTRRIVRMTGKLDAASGYRDPRWGAGGIGGARGREGARRLEALYDNYLRAGQVCLEGRGYTVSR